MGAPQHPNHPPTVSSLLTVGKNEVEQDAEAELGVFLQEVVGQGSQQRHAAPVLVGQSQQDFPGLIRVEVFSEFQSLSRKDLSRDVKA